MGCKIKKMKYLKKSFFVLLLALLSLTVSCYKKNESQSQYPSKIIALSPVSVEILYAVGAENQIAAVCDLADFPEEAKNKPHVGGFDGKTISMESILSYKPDFVYLTDVMHNYMIKELESYGIQYYISKATDINSVQQEILDIGKLTGHLEKANSIVLEMKEKIESLCNKTQNPVSIYYEIWNSPYMTIGSESFINDIIACTNSINIFNDIQDSYPIISEESIIKKQPQIILLPASNGITIEQVKQRKGWDSIPAVKNNKVFIIDDNLYTRAGPRIPLVIEDLISILNK